MLSGDPYIAELGSESHERMEEYSKLLDWLEIVLFLRENRKKKLGRNLSSSRGYVHIASGRFARFFYGFRRADEMLQKKKFDVITGQDIEHAFLALILSKKHKVPFQIQIHTDIFNLYFWRQSLSNKFRVILAKILLNQANCIRVVSERIKKSILIFNPNLESKIITLPIFIDTDNIKNTASIHNLHQDYKGKFIILMASRITKEKNIGLAIDAVSVLIKKFPNLLLLIVGTGPEKENLESKIKKYGLEAYVFMKTKWEQISYYKTCDLFLLTSNYEGYGMTLVEAAAAGAKIISSDVGIAPEILERESIVSVDDRNALVEKLTQALRGNLKPPKTLKTQTKEEYLRLYLDSFKQCLSK